MKVQRFEKILTCVHLKTLRDQGPHAPMDVTEIDLDPPVAASARIAKQLGVSSFRLAHFCVPCAKSLGQDRGSVGEGPVRDKLMARVAAVAEWDPPKTEEN